MALESFFFFFLLYCMILWKNNRGHSNIIRLDEMHPMPRWSTSMYNNHDKAVRSIDRRVHRWQSCGPILFFLGTTVYHFYNFQLVSYFSDTRASRSEYLEYHADTMTTLASWIVAEKLLSEFCLVKLVIHQPITKALHYLYFIWMHFVIFFLMDTCIC